jgi:hypothetical protein
MWSKRVSSGLAVVLAVCLQLPSVATDANLARVFAETDKYAKQQKQFASDQTAEKQQASENIKQIEKITSELNTSQLLELIKFSHTKMQGEPFKHGEPYLNYHESVVHFSIRKLGKMTSPEAVTALNEKVPKIVLIDGSMGLVYDEAKEEQAKLLKAQHS